MPDGERTTAGSDALEALDGGPPHFGQGWPNFMVQGNPVQLEKAAVGFPIVGPDFFNRSANCLRNFATFGAMTTRQ